MTVEVDVHTIAFWLSMAFLLFGCFMGLLGTWIDEFWKSDTAIKLMVTNLIFFAGSVGTAIISKWLA